MPITSFLGLGPADSSLNKNNSACLKIHQNAVFYILTRTWIHLLKSQAKNHATSSFSQKINTFRLLALYFFSLRTVKNYPLFSGLKTPQSTLTLTIRKKHNFQAPLPIRFSSVHCQKHLNHSLFSSKTPQPNQQILINSQKKHPHFQAPARTCLFPLHCYKSSVLQSPMTKKHRTVTHSSQSGKNATFGSCRVCFPFTHCQKSLIFLFCSEKRSPLLSLTIKD